MKIRIALEFNQRSVIDTRIRIRKGILNQVSDPYVNGIFPARVHSSVAAQCDEDKQSAKHGNCITTFVMPDVTVY